MLDVVRFSARADATRTKPYVSGGAQYTYAEYWSISGGDCEVRAALPTRPELI